VPFVTCSDVEDLQAELKAQGEALTQCVADNVSAGTLSPLNPLLAQWTAMSRRIDTFVAESCTNIPPFSRAGSQMDEGQQIQRDVQPWYGKLVAAGCKGVPMAPTPPPAPQDLFGNLENIGLLIVAIMVLKELHA